MMAAALEAISEKGKQVVFTGLEQISRNSKIKCLKDIPYGDEAGQLLDLYQPVDQPVRHTLLFIHGGSWQYGNKNEYAFIGQSLARRGIATLVMGYRLFPRARYPGFVEDAASALAWYSLSSGYYGLENTPLFLMGHSAGAHIALLVALDQEFSRQYAFQQDMIKGVVSLAGVYSFRPEKSALYQQIFPADLSGENYARVKPVNFVRPDGIPLYLLHGRKDRTVACRSAERMYKNALLAGHPVFLEVRENDGHYAILFDFFRFSPRHEATASALEYFMQDHS